jgi:predicted short-subunit dehydrogenase-like oxidoreductase (DUF2520 family)
MKIILIGAGALGSSLHEHFVENKVEHSWFNKGIESKSFTKNNILEEKSLYLFAVQESKLENLLNMFSDNKYENYLVHFSASLDFSIFPENKASKNIILHPMYSFTKSKTHERLNSIYFTFQGSKKDQDYISKILSLKTIYTSIKNAKLYHALGVFAGNFQNAIYQIVIDLAKENNLDEDDAKKLLLPLSIQTLNNIGEMDLNSALSGPAKRSEWEIIKNQENEIRLIDKDYADLYHILNKVIKNKILKI